MIQRLIKSAKGIIPRPAIDLVKKAARPVRRHFYLLEHVTPAATAPPTHSIPKCHVIRAAERVHLGDPDRDPFVPIGKYYREGYFDRSDVIVAELPEAYLHVGTGMVCTRDFKAVINAEYIHLLDGHPTYQKRRPRNVTRLAGTYSSVYYNTAWNYYAWAIDCLSRVHSLAQAEPREPVKLIMPDFLPPAQRESLDCILPPHFTVEYHPGDTWLRFERFLWPSVPTGRCNGFLPPEHFEAIRQPTFQRYGLPSQHPLTERIYVTRRLSRNRRVLNEDAVMAVLERFNFKLVEIEKLSFREQVELFHRAQIVIGPHGAGLHLTLYSGKISVLIFEANRKPQNYFHTLAKGLGHHHHFLLPKDDGDESRDFEVDLADLERMLTTEMGLTPKL